MMKNFAILMSLIATLSLSGCGGDEPKTETPEKAPVPAAASSNMGSVKAQVQVEEDGQIKTVTKTITGRKEIINFKGKPLEIIVAEDGKEYAADDGDEIHRVKNDVQLKRYNEPLPQFQEKK